MIQANWFATATCQPISSLPVTSRPIVTIAEAGLHEIGNEQLQPVGRTWVAHLTKIRRKDEVLRADLLHD